MSRRPCTFRQRDVSAAVKALKQSGCEVSRVEIGKDGKIVVVTTKPGAPVDDPEINEWDAGQ